MTCAYCDRPMAPQRIYPVLARYAAMASEHAWRLRLHTVCYYRVMLEVSQRRNGEAA